MCLKALWKVNRHYLLHIIINHSIEQVEASKSDIPKGFKMPESEKDFMPTAPAELEEDENL